MEDPVEIRRRIDALVARVDRRGDYGQLLARGEVVRPVADVPNVENWRAEMRQEARADRIKIRTGATSEYVYALLVGAATRGRRAEHGRYLNVLRSTMPDAIRHRHEPVVVIRDGDEVLFGCGRCSALGYSDAANSVIGGDLLESDCPHGGPPRPTALSMFF